jgi:outer membrane protein assembly factor BamB
MGGYATGPRASVLLADGKGYALGATGVVCCMELSSGKVLWQRDLVTEEKAVIPL